MNLDQLANELLGQKATAEYQDPPRRLLGYWIFLWLLLLSAVVGGLLTAYAFATFPRLSDIQATLRGQPGPDVLKAYDDARSAWVAQFKDLGQLYLVTPILPLLAAVLGYIFGHQTSTREDASS